MESIRNPFTPKSGIEPSDNERQILAVLVKENQQFDYLQIATIVKTDYGMSANTMSKLLERLVHKRIVEHPERGVYFISDYLFREYIKRKTTEPTNIL